MPEDAGEFHNKLIIAYYAASYPDITPSNYLIEIPIADDFFLQEITKISDNDFKINSDLQKERHLSYVSEVISYQPLSLKYAFELITEKLTKISAVGYSASKLLYFYKEILFASLDDDTNLLSNLVKFENKMMSFDLNSCENEILVSLISVTKNSFIYWTDKGVDQPAGFIIGDCVGYLAGWGSATWDDYWNGNLNPRGQGRRIGQGLIWGAAGSVATGPF